MSWSGDVFVRGNCPVNIGPNNTFSNITLLNLLPQHIASSQTLRALEGSRIQFPLGSFHSFFYTPCTTTCFIDARMDLNLYSIVCPLGGVTCFVDQTCKKSCFYKFRKNQSVRLCICIYGTNCCVVQHEGMCSFYFTII